MGKLGKFMVGKGLKLDDFSIKQVGGDDQL